MQKCTQYLSIIQVGLKAYWQNVCWFHIALKKLTKRITSKHIVFTTIITTTMTTSTTSTFQRPNLHDW